MRITHSKDKGGQNPTNKETNRPAPPKGSGSGNVPYEQYKLRNVDHRCPVKIEDDRIFAYYSICSEHFWFDPKCTNCLAGMWTELDEETGQPKPEST